MISLKDQSIPSENAPPSAPTSSWMSTKRYLPDIPPSKANVSHTIRISHFAEYVIIFIMSTLKTSKISRNVFSDVVLNQDKKKLAICENHHMAMMMCDDLIFPI